ncbi:hypothetical protein ACT7CW_24500 [Bacillus pacificus]
MGIMFSGVTGVSAAQINDVPSKASASSCKNVNHKFSELFDSKPPKNIQRTGLKERWFALKKV